MNRHEMFFERTYNDGSDEWYCSVCDRKILLNVPPNSEIVVLQEGDLSVSHYGSMGGLRVDSVQVGNDNSQ